MASSIATALKNTVLPLLADWREEAREASWSNELMAAVTVASMSVPQGVAYALIAGLPPAVGLVAGGIPAIVGSLFRSSRHVVSGPTNALSLLVGTSVAAQFDDPVTAAATLAGLVGVMQIAAALLRLGAVVDYVSAAVVTGYVTGAGILIGAGQLSNVTGTEGVRGDLVTQVSHWVGTLLDTHLPTLALAVGTIVLILGLRRVVSKSAAALIAVSMGVVVTVALDLGGQGVRLVRDLASVPQGLPPLVMPDLSLVAPLVPIALAGVLLSLVESTSVARSIAGRTGQQLDLGLEFFGMGLANLASGLFGSFPVSGSLSRSAINEQSGARTRFAGALSGVLMLGVLLGLGPIVDLMPIASLAGLLVVVAVDLVDVRRIRRLLKATVSDRFAFLGTLVGTWVLPLDQAIAVGGGVNLIIFLQQAQSLLVRELIVDEEAFRLREVELDAVPPDQCRAIRILHLEGALFFGASGALERAVRPILADDEARFLIVRIKRTRGLDYTTAEVFGSIHHRLAARGRKLLIVGLRQREVDTLDRSGVGDQLHDNQIYPTRPGWFVAMNEAIGHALAHLPPGHADRDCILAEYLRRRAPALADSTTRADLQQTESHPPARTRSDDMHIEAFYDDATSTLTYVVSDPATKDAVIIDPVLDFDPQWVHVQDSSVQRVARYVEDHALTVHYILDTHVHADHFTGSQALKQRLGGKVGIGRTIGVVQETFKGIFNWGSEFATDGSQFDVLLEDGVPLQAGSLTIHPLHTPGHTPADMTYRIGDALFTGDTMFMPDFGTGRTDFPGGSAEQLYDSIKKLYGTFPDDTRIFVGHDYQPGGRELAYQTTIGEAKRANKQLRAETTKAEFVRWREERDKTLKPPQLILQSLQVNANAGHLPDAEDNGRRYLRMPLGVFS